MTAQPTATPPPGIDYRRKWLVMVAVGLGVFLGTIDGSIVNVALPTLTEEFHTTFAAVQWVVLSYLLTLVTLTLGIGRLGDMFGKRRIYSTGFAVFTFGSALAGLSPSVHWLIFFRVVQALGSSMIFALGLAIITEAFPPYERGRALGISGALVSIGIVVGPTLGGLIISDLSWRWIFYVNLPIGIAGTIAAARLIQDVPPPGRQRFDFVGAGALCASLLTLMLSLSLAQNDGFGNARVVVLAVVGAITLAVFVAIERRVEQPMLDLTLFRSRLLSINLVTGWLTFVGMSGILLLLPFYLEGVLGYQPRAVGLLMAPAPIALGLAAPFSGAISDRIGPRPVTVAGLATLLVGYLIASRFLATDTTVIVLIVLMAPIGLGMGIFQSPNNSAVMGSVPRHRLGVTSAMLTITRNTGQLVGVSVLGSVWALRLARHAGTAAGRDAPAADQVAALQETVLVVAVLIAVALALSVWGLVTERRQRAGAASEEPAAAGAAAG